MPCSSERTWRQSRSGVCRKHATAPGICANHTQQITRIDLKNHQKAQRERKIDAAPTPHPPHPPHTPSLSLCEYSQLLIYLGSGETIHRSSNVCVIKCSRAHLVPVYRRPFSRASELSSFDRKLSAQQPPMRSAAMVTEIGNRQNRHDIPIAG